MIALTAVCLTIAAVANLVTACVLVRGARRVFAQRSPVARTVVVQAPPMTADERTVMELRTRRRP